MALLSRLINKKAEIREKTERVSNTLGDQMQALDKRFDDVKMQELKQRRMIESIIAKRFKQRLLAKTFNSLRRLHRIKSTKKKREDLALNWHYTKLRNLLFRSWRNQTRQDSHTIFTLKANNTAKLEARKGEYALLLNEFKVKIIEVEQKIAMVDESYDHFTKSLSTSYVQAINLLNAELMNLQAGQASNLISG